MSRKIVVVAALVLCLISGSWSFAQKEQNKVGVAAPATPVEYGLILLSGGAAGPKEGDEFDLALRRPVKLEFADTPLSDAVDFCAGHLDINIRLDNKGLADAAIDPSTPVTFSLRKPIPFESALQLILDELDLTFTVQHEVLLITSKEKADEILTTKVYFVGDLFAAAQPRRQEWGPLMQLIRSTVQPDSWDDNGGPATIQPFTAGEALVISQKQAVHGELDELFVKLRAEMKEHEITAQSRTKEPFTKLYQLGSASGEQMAEAIQKLIEPATWEARGGVGEVRVIRGRSPAEGKDDKNITPSHDALLVRQTANVHDTIDEVLNLPPLGQGKGSRGFGGMGGGMGSGTGGGMGGMGGGMGGGMFRVSAEDLLNQHDD